MRPGARALHVRPVLVALVLGGSLLALSARVVVDRAPGDNGPPVGGFGPAATIATAAPRASVPIAAAAATPPATTGTTAAGTRAGTAATIAVPTVGDDWVPVPGGLRTRCADEPGLRLYLVDGEREPVGLLDDTCRPGASR